MEQNMRFGLLLSQLEILKKKLGPIISKFFGERFFYVFRVKKVFYKYCSTKSFYKTFFEFFSNSFLAPNGLNIHNQFFLALLETPPCTTSI